MSDVAFVLKVINTVTHTDLKQCTWHYNAAQLETKVPYVDNPDLVISSTDSC